MQFQINKNDGKIKVTVTKLLLIASGWIAEITEVQQHKCNIHEDWILCTLAIYNIYT